MHERADDASPGRDDSGPLVLRSTSSRIGKAIGALFFAGFWNGIVSIFVVHLVNSALRGSFEWFLGLFLIPFVLIGLGLIGFFVHSFLGLFAPRVVVTLSHQRLRLGEGVELDWRFTGRTHRIEKLTIGVEGSEEATYRRGTRSTTDRHVFARIPLITSTDISGIRSGRVRLQLPFKSVPTFNARNNKIVWSLRIDGVIRRFPDVADAFPLNVLPAVTEASDA